MAQNNKKSYGPGAKLDNAPVFSKVLIANRGEIAIRIARTCKRMALKTVGVYSELDVHSQHLDFCDEVYSLGKGSIADTYLNIPKLIDILQQSGAGAVHPGYGFLSERAAFAEAVAAAGAVFVGPSPESIRVMGDKISAKRAMQAMGVPLLPGTDSGVKDLAQAREAARGMGYPVLLKAAAGGGGKGMRIVRGETDLAAALEGAVREAKNYFGDGTVYLEKYLENPHHIEVQVVGDGHGGGGHVYDRECSIQRRHQKLVEESPAPLMNRFPESKQKLLDVASQVVAKMKYASAGTLEFLADEDGNFYFLEMNTRLQVEHPVTEWVTGLDLVELQLRVAQGERLPAGPIVAQQTGHSIEVRIYAETPFDHLPTGGRVHALQLPTGPFVRVDSAIYAGYEVPSEYDPTLMKLSVWGQTRAEAIGRLRVSIEELRILGVQSNQALFWAISRETDFIDGLYGTPYLEKRRGELKSMVDARLQELAPIVSRIAVEATKRVAGPNGISLNGKTDGAPQSIWTVIGRREQLRGQV